MEKICKYFSSDMGCKNGSTCKFSHIITSHKQYIEKEKENINVILVALENTICFFNEGVIDRYNFLNNGKKKMKNANQMRSGNIKGFFRRNESSLIDEIIGTPGLFKIISPIPGAIRAINEMRSLGLDVRIVCEIGPNINEKITWILQKFSSADWEERIIITGDKTMLRGDIFIDSLGTPTYTERNIELIPPTWEHVVFDKPYNHKLTSLRRIKDWGEWKISLDMDEIITRGCDIKGDKYDEIQYFQHGSEDSKDIDKFYLFSYIPTNKEAHEFCRGTGEEDRNIIVVEDGIIIYAFKGSANECNNAFFTTFPNHKQRWPNPVKHKICRNVTLKYISVIRKICALYHSKCTSFDIKEEPRTSSLLKSLKKTDFSRRRRVFSEIDFKTCKSWNIQHDLKFAATQLTMLYGLITGIEVYTKTQIIEQFPNIKPFIRRHESSLDDEVLECLNKLKEDIVTLTESIHTVQYNQVVLIYSNVPLLVVEGVQETKTKYEDKDFIDEKDPIDEKDISVVTKSLSHLQYQARGVVVDLLTETCLYYGLDQFSPTPTHATWPFTTLSMYEQLILKLKHMEVKDIVGIIKIPKAKTREETVVIISNNRFYEEEEAALLLTEEYKTALEFDKYYHVFAVIETKKDEESHKGIRCLVLVALRSTKTLQVIQDEHILLSYTSLHNLK